MTAMSKAEKRARELLANNGRNPDNNNEGIRVGSHLHLCEQLLFDIDTLRGHMIGARAEDAAKKDMIAVSGIHLWRNGDYVIVEAEIQGKWVEVIRERHEGNFGHIVEPGGMRRAAASMLTSDGLV